MRSRKNQSYQPNQMKFFYIYDYFGAKKSRRYVGSKKWYLFNSIIKFLVKFIPFSYFITVFHDLKWVLGFCRQFLVPQYNVIFLLKLKKQLWNVFFTTEVKHVRHEMNIMSLNSGKHLCIHHVSMPVIKTNTPNKFLMENSHGTMDKFRAVRVSVERFSTKRFYRKQQYRRKSLTNRPFSFYRPDLIFSTFLLTPLSTNN